MADKFVYLDQNVLGDIADGDLTLPTSVEFDWVYSDEHFTEIKRGETVLILDVLAKLKARKIELKLDDQFRITGEATVRPFEDPHRLYQHYVEALGDVSFDENIFLQPLARMYGADNYSSLTSLSDDVRRQLTALLEQAGLLDIEHLDRMEEAVKASRSLVVDHLNSRVPLEDIRKGLGTHQGRASNLAKGDNPLADLWNLMKDRVRPLTADQFFGFDPLDMQGYESWPLYLGIVGCYTVLNFVGLRPDDGLSQAKRMPAILSDASHAGYAAYCCALLSQDQQFCNKASAIYRYRNIGTVVILAVRKSGTTDPAS